MRRLLLTAGLLAGFALPAAAAETAPFTQAAFDAAKASRKTALVYASPAWLTDLTTRF